MNKRIKKVYTFKLPVLWGTPNNTRMEATWVYVNILSILLL